MLNGLFFFIKQGWDYDKRYILWRLFHPILHGLIPLTTTLASKYIFDALETGQHARLFLPVVLFLGCTAAATGLCNFFSWDGFTRRLRVNSRFDKQLHRNLAQADFENLENPHFLNLQEQAKQFLYCNGRGFGYLLDCAANFLGCILTLMGVLAIICTLNLSIVLLLMVLTLLGAVLELHAKRKALRLSDQIIAKQRGWAYYAQLFEDFNYGKETRINGMCDWLLNREQRYLSKVLTNYKQQNDGLIRAGSFGAFFTFAQQAVAYGHLLQQIGQGTLSIGSFAMYVGAVTVFADTFRAMLSSLGELTSYDLYYNNLEHYLSIPAKLRTATLPPPSKTPCIAFYNVGFRYAGSQSWALRNINLEINPGEKIAIVGENGAGKTTLIKLLLRLYAPTEGEILMDGVNIQTMEYDRYMALFSAVLQDYKLFSFSLQENISLCQPIDEAKLEHILQQVGLGPRLDTLPYRLQTQIHKNFDPHGYEPSGGEGQRIAIARALYKDAPIVILDEPTAALDPKAEFAIYQQFHSLVSGKTALYISHRLSSTRFCNKIAVLDRGILAEWGSHDDLLKANGTYAALFHMQAQFYV